MNQVVIQSKYEQLLLIVDELLWNLAAILPKLCEGLLDFS
jgi:hypothetical protein